MLRMLAIPVLSLLFLTAAASAEPQVQMGAPEARGAEPQLQVADPQRRVAEPPQAVRVAPAQEAYLRERLNQAQRRELGTIGRSVATSRRVSREAESRWNAVVAEVARDGQPVDVAALVQMVMRECYLETDRDLRQHAERVRSYNERKRAIRQRLQETRAQRPGGKALDAEIQKLEEELQNIGDDAQLANIDLQNALQRQQQLVQMLSQISKQLHDTAMAVIRKMGG